MNLRPTRGGFLRTAGSVASAAVVSSSLLDARIALGATPYVRRDIGNLLATDPIIVSYRHAVAAMRALPTTDPRSWAYQAAIHGTTSMQNLPAWNTCQHGNYFFWSWHRMYLYYFERIIRKMSYNPNWALPYWNWTSSNERHLPPMFRDPTSELYTPNRNPSMNNGTGSLPASDVNYTTAFNFTAFTSASASLEGTPHGAVHVDVGGWMGSVPTAGQDPIFYLHHCNIDRLWNLWLAQMGGRMDPLSDNTWKNTQFTFFDENGATVHMTGCDVLRAAQQLNYVYEGEPPQVVQNCVRFIQFPYYYYVLERIRLPIPPEILGSSRVSFPLFEAKAMRQRLAAAAASKTENVLLELDDVVADRQPGVVWEVYVGLPSNAPANPESPFYVGNLAMFGTGIRAGAHNFQPAKFSYAIDRAVLASFGLKEERVSVTFVPHGILINGRPSTPEALSPVRVGVSALVIEAQRKR
jgi:tyrosinase